MKKITGKRVTIISHSLGSVVTWRNLLNIEQSKKDSLISRWIAIAPAFLGSQEATINVIGLSGDIQGLKDIYIPINEQSVYMVMEGFLSLFQLLPKDTMTRFKDTTWMKALNDRMEAESKGDMIFNSQHPVISLFPHQSAHCTIGFPDIKMDQKCSIGITGQLESAFVDLKSYLTDEYSDFVDKFSYFEHAKDLFELGQDEQLNNLENPGVQLTIIYSNHVKTPNSISYNDNPKTYSSNKKIYPPDSILFTRGDGSLTTKSTILPGIKWADDFNNGLPGSKPIIFAEGCSEYHQKSSLFDNPEILEKHETNGGKILKDNSYMGVKCACYHGRFQNDNGYSMAHAKIHADPHIVNFVTKSLLNDEKSEGMHPDYKKFSHDEWD